MRRTTIIALIFQVLTAGIATAGTTGDAETMPTVDEALRARLITPALRQQVGDDAQALKTLVEIAQRARAMGADDRRIQKLQREVRRGRNTNRRARLEIELIRDVAVARKVLTRRQADGIGQDAARLFTMLQAKQLVAMGAITETQLSVARYDREKIQKLADVWAIGTTLGLTTPQIRNVQHQSQKAGSRLSADELAVRLIVMRLELPEAARRARLSAANLLETAARAVWLAPTDDGWRSIPFWQHVKKAGAAVALRERFAELHPSVPAELYAERDIAFLVEGVGAARALGTEADNDAYWASFTAFEAKAIDNDTFVAQWYDAERAEVRQDAAEAPSATMPAALTEVMTYADRLIRAEILSMPEISLDPRREDSLVHLVRRMAPALAYAPASATRR